jgi:hypothetical protein
MTDTLAPNAELLISTDMLRMVLDLPASMRIIGIRAEPLDQPHTMRLQLDWDDLAPVLPGGVPALVVPTYARVDTCKAELHNLRITPAEHTT